MMSSYQPFGGGGKGVDPQLAADVEALDNAVNDPELGLRPKVGSIEIDLDVLEADVRGPVYTETTTWPAGTTRVFTIPYTDGSIPTLGDLGLTEPGTINLSAASGPAAGLPFSFGMSPDFLFSTIFPYIQDVLGTIPVLGANGSPSTLDVVVQPSAGSVTVGATKAAYDLGLAGLGQSLTERVEALEVPSGGGSGGLPAFWADGDIVRVPEDFSTIASALATIRARYPAPDARVTLQLGPGYHDIDTLIELIDEDLSFLSIVGSPAIYETGPISTTVSYSGSSENWSVTYALTSDVLSNFEVGDYVQITSTEVYTSPNQLCAQGYFGVTAKLGAGFTVSNLGGVSALAGATVSVKFKKYATHLRSDGVLFRGIRSRLPQFRDLGIVNASDRDANGYAFHLGDSVFTDGGSYYTDDQEVPIRFALNGFGIQATGESRIDLAVAISNGRVPVGVYDGVKTHFPRVVITGSRYESIVCREQGRVTIGHHGSRFGRSVICGSPVNAIVNDGKSLVTIGNASVYGASASVLSRWESMAQFLSTANYNSASPAVSTSESTSNRGSRSITI
ncbi:hypothetical protein SAMN06297251_10452 [Fulvimarina manganoxydans]|uniref:Uncharacterized protein n=1 Tax=Fulvimarina manganoxydans TaxID=937218 RepID=A0A1W2A9V2_9HYPH|nr:hypothetical protein [Fulvimarina manganoxydans]SMC57457.1 hypothetical protein SAMN06297251_10452 [Fulvimarina manganoxydans]